MTSPAGHGIIYKQINKQNRKTNMLHLSYIILSLQISLNDSSQVSVSQMFLFFLQAFVQLQICLTAFIVQEKYVEKVHFTLAVSIRLKFIIITVRYQSCLDEMRVK